MHVLRSLALLFAALTMEVSGTLASSFTYHASVRVLNYCRSATAPTVWISRRLTASARARFAGRIVVQSMPGGWTYDLRVPREYTYLWFETARCASLVRSISIDGSPRSYVTLLERDGGDTAVGPRDSYMLGTLPFPGVASVELVDPTTWHVVREATVVGSTYYIAYPPAGKLVLRVQPSLDVVFALFPVTIAYAPSDKWPDRFVLNISFEALWRGLIQESGFTLTPAQ